MTDMTAEAAVELGKNIAKGSYDRGFLEGVLYTSGLVIVGALVVKVVSPEKNN